MKTSIAIKTLLAASVLAAAGFANAQVTSVSGNDQDANIVVGLNDDSTRGSYIDIDQDVENLYGCLAFLKSFRMYVPTDSDHNAGWSRDGHSYGPNATPDGPSWYKNFVDEENPCGLEAIDVEGELGVTGFTVTYLWGVTLTDWLNGKCGAVDSNEGADTYTGTYDSQTSPPEPSYSGNNPRWDCGLLVVDTDVYFNPVTITLVGREYLTTGPTSTDFIHALGTP